MTNIRNSLENLASTIEELQNRKQPLVIKDNQLSGDKIDGGTITNFSSTGIKDLASKAIVTVQNDGIHLETLHVDYLHGPVSLNGNLSVEGTVKAKRLEVDEIIAKVESKISDPISFIEKGNKTAYNKGLLWPGGDYTKQFLLMERPDRFFATESVELRANKIYMINGQNVLSQDTLGTTVVNSNIKNLGTLNKLNVDGPLNIDNFIVYDANSQRLAIGSDTPNGTLSITNWDHEFIIDGEDRKFKVGTYTTGALEIITDDTPRISIESSGAITIHKKTVIQDKLGVGVKNFDQDADITSAGPIRFQNKKFEVGNEKPSSGTYVKGDIVWNSNPEPSGYVGWICTRSGTPGTWKTFGSISS